MHALHGSPSRPSQRSSPPPQRSPVAARLPAAARTAPTSSRTWLAEQRAAQLAVVQLSLQRPQQLQERCLHVGIAANACLAQQAGCTVNRG